MKRQNWCKHTLSFLLVFTMAFGMGMMNTSAAEGDTVQVKVKNSDETLKLDKNNLKDGVYSVNVDMYKLDRKNKSMSDNAVEHKAKLEVNAGEYFMTLDFQGMTVGKIKGYFSKLSYYAEGYNYNQNGIPTGDLITAEVLSTQKNADGSDIIDQYNSADSLYPKEVRIKLVPAAIADPDGFVPLQVFIPLMNVIAPGNGAQDVLMKIDWTALTKIEVKKGDIDANGSVDLADAQTTLKAALKIITLDDSQKAIADVDGEEGVSLSDAQLILKAALKIITL